MTSFRLRPRCTVLLGALAALALVAGAQAEPLSRATPARTEGSGMLAARIAVGSIDADVLDRSGPLLGHLSASVARSGRGLGVFRATHRNAAASQAVSTRARGATLRIVGQHGLRLDARIARSGRLSGSGRLGSRHVRLRGVAGEQHPDLRPGMKMLVVGKPRGKGYTALREMFDSVRYRPAAHSRAGFLADRKRFHGFAAIVFGPSIRPADVRDHELLSAFYGTGKWVIVAPATKRTQAVLGKLQGYRPARQSAALALRATGAVGGPDRVRPTIAYAAPAKFVPLARGTASRPSAADRRASDRRRAAWFRERLLEFGRAQMRSARDVASRRLQGSDGSVEFDLPYNAAAIELAVPYYHEWTLTGSANGEGYKSLDACGYAAKSNAAWCAGSQHYAAKGADALAACKGFLADGYQMVEGDLVKLYSGYPSPAPEEYHPDLHTAPDHQLKWTNGLATFNQNPEGMAHGPSQCPENHTQTTTLQGNDYYYAIYNPGQNQHSVIVLTDPTVSASSTGQLAVENATNGTYVQIVHGGIVSGYQSVHVKSLKETMVFLGAYEHTIAINGANLDDSMLEYSGNKSFPNNQITFDSKSTGTSTTQSFGVGIFGDMGTMSYDRTESHSASVTVDVPSWAISPVPGQRRIGYQWTTNDPLPWQTIADHDSSHGPPSPVDASWDLNPLNKTDFSPTSLSVWTGAQTYGLLTVASDRTLRLVDHFSYFDSSAGEHGPRESFWVSNLTASDSPDTNTPVTTNSVGPGLNLCDPLVRAPSRLLDCHNFEPLVPPKKK
jgi:hypothetical protein